MAAYMPKRPLDKRDDILVVERIDATATISLHCHQVVLPQDTKLM
jgi:hypothetical protein